MKLIVTIDTEEDNWNNFSRTDNPCSNIEYLTCLQEVLDSYNVVPTYLITYPVLKDQKSQTILQQFLKEGKCEIGTHCHPWNTPPFEEELNKKNVMLNNLPYELLLKKISLLHKGIKETFGITPVAFRSGRFAFNTDVAKVLMDLGYKVDTSIPPYEDWTIEMGPDFSHCSPDPYFLSENDFLKADPCGSLLEIPLSIGFLQENFERSNFLYKKLKKKPFKWLKIIGTLNRLHLLNMASLCPESCDEKGMTGVAKVFKKKNFKIINMMFHSTSLKSGLNDFTKTRQEENRIFRRIKTFLQFAKDEGIEPLKVSDAPQLFRSNS